MRSRRPASSTDTLIMFTSDNGFFHGEHRVQTGKNRVYEEAVRVPLVIRGPGVPEGVTVEDLAVNADLAPTVVDAAGASAGLAVDGRSLLPSAEHPDRLRGRELLLEKGDVRRRRRRRHAPERHLRRRAHGRYVYVENLTGELELYDLDARPVPAPEPGRRPRLRRGRGGARRAAGGAAQLRGHELRGSRT